MSDHTRDFVKRSPVELNGTVLQCPNCGNEYLHQDKIHVYTRETEYSLSKVLIVDAEGCEDHRMCEEEHRTLKPLGNPSKRRDGIRIFFRCEDCDASIHMTIAQNKGNTNVEMEHIEHGRFSVVAWP